MSSSFKKHIFKTRFLKASLEEAEEIHDKAKIEFFDEIRMLQSELNVYDEALDGNFKETNQKKPTEKELGADSQGPNSESFDEENSEVDKDIVTHPAWAKKLYRKITLKTHPDKLLDLKEEERLKKISVYTNAVEDYKTKNYSGLVLSAIDLNIELPNDKEVVLILKKKCSTIESNIEKIKKTLFWIWHHSTESERKEILKKFVEARGWTAPGAAVRKSRNRSHPGKSLAWARKKLAAEE